MIKLITLSTCIALVCTIAACKKKDTTPPGDAANTLVIDGKVLNIYSAARNAVVTSGCAATGSTGGFVIRAANSQLDSVYLYVDNIKTFSGNNTPDDVTNGTVAAGCKTYISGWYKNGTAARVVLNSYSGGGILELTANSFKYRAVGINPNSDMFYYGNPSRIIAIRFNGTY